MSYTPATITGTYKKQDGSPASGRVLFIPNSKVIVDSGGNVILAGRLKQSFEGTFSIQIPPTDDETLSPAIDRQWTIAVQLDHSNDVPTITGQEFVGGQTYDMADLTSSAAVVASLGSWLSQSAYDDLIAAAEAVQGVLATTDGLVAPLVPTSSGSAVSTAVAAAVVTQGDVRYPKLTDLTPLVVKAEKIDRMTVGTSGTVVVTLGADPLDVANTLWVFQNGVLVDSTKISVVGRVVTITGYVAAAILRIRYVYNSAQTAAAATVPTLTVIAADDYNRGDSSVGLGVSSSGHTYRTLTGVMGIASNQARKITTGAGFNDGAVLDIGDTNHIHVRAKLAVVNGSPGLALCALDADHLFSTNLTALFKRDGSNTSIRTFTNAIAAGDTIGIEIDRAAGIFTPWRDAGSTGTFVQNGAPVTNTFQAGQDGFGIRVSSDGTHVSRWDNLQIIAA